LAGLPELGTLNRKQVAALAGIAPPNRDSDLFGVADMSGVGEHILRAVLYMSTLSAVRCNPVIKAFRQRLITVGKKPKVVLTACTRKLHTILNKMVKDQKSWAPRYGEIS